MQYAIQTRDYKNDYRWSWEERGRDFPLARISLELQRLLKDGEQGVAVLVCEGKFHLILSAINRLGMEPIGKDFSGANIRLNIVFSDISQQEAKGLIRYYITNRENLGNAFPDIVTWNTSSWWGNEAKVQEAFSRISPSQMTGKKLVCLEGSGEPLDWLEYDLSETNGVKFVLQADQLKFAVDSAPMPINEPSSPREELSPPKNKKRWGNFVITALFLLLVTAIGYLLYEKKQPENMPTQENLPTTTTNQDQRKKKPEEDKSELTTANEKLRNYVPKNEYDYLDNQLKEFESELVEVQRQLKTSEDKLGKIDYNDKINQTGADKIMKTYYRHKDEQDNTSPNEPMNEDRL